MITTAHNMQQRYTKLDNDENTAIQNQQENHNDLDGIIIIVIITPTISNALQHDTITTWARQSPQFGLESTEWKYVFSV